MPQPRGPRSNSNSRCREGAPHGPPASVAVSVTLFTRQNWGATHCALLVILTGVSAGGRRVRSLIVAPSTPDTIGIYLQPRFLSPLMTP